MFENKRMPPIIAQTRKRQAQVSAGKLALNHIGKVDEAKSVLSEAEELLRDDREIRLDLPATEVHPGGSRLRGSTRCRCRAAKWYRSRSPGRSGLR